MPVDTPVQRRAAKRISARYKEKRRGHRMNSRVPICLEWDSTHGKRVKVEAHTRVINPYGCMIILEQDLHLDQRVALSNLAMNSSNAAIVVWKSDVRPEGGWEYGIELVAPAMDFWGLEL